MSDIRHSLFRGGLTCRKSGVMSANKILIVEDEAFIGLDLAEGLSANDFVVVGPVGNVTDALALIEQDSPDAALLDVNLGKGQTSSAVAERLQQLNIPFAFLTGYREGEFISEFRKTVHISKPVMPETVLREVRKLLDATGYESIK